jgi:hypothetical protein
MNKEELEKAYKKAEEFKEKYGEAVAYEYLMELLYFKINGKFKEE